MRVVVRLFARVRDIVGDGEFERDVAPDATVRTVWQALVADHPDLTPYASSISVAVNTEYARMDTRVREGDEIAFLPPVSGGARDTYGHHD